MAFSVACALMGVLGAIIFLIVWDCRRMYRKLPPEVRKVVREQWGNPWIYRGIE